MRQRVERERGKETGSSRDTDTQRDREMGDRHQLEHSLLNGKSPLHTSSQGLGNPTEEEVERVLEPERTEDSKKTRPFKTRSYKTVVFNFPNAVTLLYRSSCCGNPQP